MKIVFYIFILIFSTLSLATENSIASLAETLKQRDKEYQTAEQERESTKNLILAAKSNLLNEIIKAAWEVFSELKQQGVHFKNDLKVAEPYGFCPQTIEKLSSDEFIVVRKPECHEAYVRFEPAGTTSDVNLSAYIDDSKVDLDHLKFDNQCIIYINIDKQYKCPDLMKPEISSVINKDVRELIAKELSQ